MNSIVVHEHNVSDIERMAKAIATSKLFGIQNPEQAIALCLIAQAEGRHPASAAQDYHIIQGRPAKKADAMLRDFLSGGGKVEWHKLDDAMADATFSHPAGGTVRITWDMARAKQAQLKTAMWDKYPRQMLRARVVSEGVRTVFPMATSGMYVPEEVQEFDPPKNTPPEPKTIEGTVSDEPDDIILPRVDIGKLEAGIDAAKTEKQLQAEWHSIEQFSVEELPQDDLDALSLRVQDRLEAIRKPKGKQRVEPNFDQFPGDMPNAA
jgi:hypothetical protein